MKMDEGEDTLKWKGFRSDVKIMGVIGIWRGKFVCTSQIKISKVQAIGEINYYLSRGIELVVIFGLRYVGTRAVGSELYRNSKVVRFTNTLVRLTSNSAVGGRFFT